MNPILKYIKRGEKRPEHVGDMYDKISLWAAMYENRAPWHNEEIKGMGIPAAIASELARLVTVELKTAVLGTERAEFLNTAYQDAAAGARQITEAACALGSVILKPYPCGKRLFTECVRPENFLPRAFDGNGNITAAAFLDRIYCDDTVYTRIEEHRLGESYVITNRAYKSNTTADKGKEIPVGSVEKWRGIEEYAEISGVDRPLFAHFKMPNPGLADCGFLTGASVYARAVDLIKDADEQYARLLWEYESGKRALFVDESAIMRDKFGRRIIPDTRLYRMLNTEDDTLFRDWSPTIRHSELNEGLNRILRAVEFNTGLAYGTLSDVNYSDKTAEEIRASKQRSYATVADIQQELKKAMQSLVYAMDVWCSVYDMAPPGEYEVSFDFDDSIIADRKAEFEEKKQLVELGIMKPWEFRSWYFGEEEKTARLMLGGKEGI